MKRSLEIFLERITQESFTDYLNETFNMYASASGVNGHVELGTIGGDDYSYAVRYNQRKDMRCWDTMGEAIDFFKTKLTVLDLKKKSQI